MGKKGAALREKKSNNAVYTFTGAQLQEHDRVVIETFRERVKSECHRKVQEDIEEQKKVVDQYIQDEWAKREELFRDEGKVMTELLSLLLCVSSRVLIEKFHWKPIPVDGYYDKRNKTVRFADLVVQEINGICEDDHKDIRRYCEETYELYGVKFAAEEEGRNEGKDTEDATE